MADGERPGTAQGDVAWTGSYRITLNAAPGVRLRVRTCRSERKNEERGDEIFHGWISRNSGWLLGRRNVRPLYPFSQKSAGCLCPNAISLSMSHRQLSKLPVVFTVEEQVDRCRATAIANL